MTDLPNKQMKTKTKPVLLRNLNRTYSARPRDIEPRWYLVDASGQTVGRMAARISKVLLGKHTPLYTAHIDTGDFVVVINSEKVVLTGKKWSQKMYHHHSGYTGGLKSFTAREKLKKDPTFPVRNAISGMLPKSILGRKMLKKLKVYAGPNHPHSAQKPVPLVLR